MNHAAKEEKSWTKRIQETTWMTLAACMWLGLYPLLNFGSYSTITLDKWRYMVILFGITVGCLIADSSAHRTRRPGKVPCVLMGFLFAWIVVSCLVSHAEASIWWEGNLARREGLATQTLYIGLFFLFSRGMVDRKPLLGSTAAGVLAFGVIVILQRLGYNPLHLFPRGTSFFTNPEFQGTIGNIDMCTGYLVVVAGVLSTDILLDFVDMRRRTGREVHFHGFLMLLLAGNGMALYLTVTMGVQFGLVSLGAYILYIMTRILPRRYRLPFILLVLLLLLLFVWFFPFGQGGLWELHEILHGRSQLSFGSNRLAAWYYSILLAEKSPLFGGGSGTFLQRFESFLAEYGYVIPSSQGDLMIPTTFDSPHNEYIALLVNHGFPALILYCLLAVQLGFRFIMEKSRLLDESGGVDKEKTGEERQRDRLEECLRSGAICYMTQAFFSFSVCIVAPAFWVIMGVLASEKTVPLICSGNNLRSKNEVDGMK